MITINKVVIVGNVRNSLGGRFAPGGTVKRDVKAAKHSSFLYVMAAENF